jgi:NADPH:quinone reductase-like Zn-dependent oxidoreductase
MRAIVQDRYGPPDEVLALGEAPDPAAAQGQVLVRVEAASIHIGDCHMVRGVPYVMRPAYGLPRPRARIPGTDFAGVVEAVGPGVTRFKPGDEVLGWGTGAFAERIAVREGALAAKPSRLTFEQAAAVGVSAFAALQGLRDQGKVTAGERVLVVGASGGVGTFAVQIARALGAEVTGVCSTRNVELVTSIGAHHVIDYTSDDFTKRAERWDLIFDNVGSTSRSAARRVLTPNGRLLSNGAPVGGWVGGLGVFVGAALTSLVVRQQLRPFVSMASASDLAALVELVEAGAMTPVIDRTYPLAEAPAALAHVTQGHTRGTTVLRT